VASSGPAILQISSYWRQGDTISFDLAPAYAANGFLLERKHSRPRAETKTVLAEILPARLAHALAEASIATCPLPQAIVTASQLVSVIVPLLVASPRQYTRLPFLRPLESVSCHCCSSH
jgi:predicted flavoprotein YhiN